MSPPCGTYRDVHQLDHCELVTDLQTSKNDGSKSSPSTSTTMSNITSPTKVDYIYESINPPIYTNFVYPFRCNPPFIGGLQLPHSNTKDIPIGTYRCYFDLPWSDSSLTSTPTASNPRSISLLLHGCGPSVFVFLNGNYIGYSTDGFLTAEFDVTQYLNPPPSPSSSYLASKSNISNTHSTTTAAPNTQRRNCLVLLCPKFSSASYLEDQDHWRLSGCFRDIELVQWNGLSPSSLQHSSTSHIPRYLLKTTPIQFETASMWIEDFHVSSAQPLGRFTDKTAERGLVQVTARFGCQMRTHGTDFLLTLNTAISLAHKKSPSNWFDQYSVRINVYKELVNHDQSLQSTTPASEHSSHVPKTSSHVPKFSYACPSPSLYTSYFQSASLSLVASIEASLSAFSSALETESSFSDSWSLIISSPLLWSDESPELYVVSLTLIQKDSHPSRKVSANSQPRQHSDARKESSNDIELSAQTGSVSGLEGSDGETPSSTRLLVPKGSGGTNGHGGSTVEDGRVIQSEACRIGFRSVEIISGELLVNKQPIMVKGVNRHEHHPLRGKVTPWESIVEDLILMKQNNFNAVRTCHYPNCDDFYNLCDRLGLYVVDEANIETHGDTPTSWNPVLSFLTIRLSPRVMGRFANDPDWERAWLDRIQRMVFRDRSHPSIVIWSMGNEAGRGQTLRKAYQWIRQIDTSERPIQYESGGCPKDHSDIYCPMYPPLKDVITYAMKTNWKQPRTTVRRCMGSPCRQSASQFLMSSCCHSTEIKRPMILCEYQHAMGNSNGSMMDYWNAFYQLKGLQGGFIWDWADQGLLKSKMIDKATSQTSTAMATTIQNYWAYGGDFNDYPNDLNFNINGLIYPDRQIKPGLIEAKYAHQPIDVEIESVVTGRLSSGQLTPSYRMNDSPRKASGLPSVGSIVLKIRSRLMFTSLSSFTFEYSLFDFLYSPKSITNGLLPVPTDIGPQSIGVVVLDLPSPLPHVAVNSDKRWLSLVVTARLRWTTSWASAGHAIGQQQLWISLPGVVSIPPKPTPPLSTPPASHPSGWSLMEMSANETSRWIVRLLTHSTEDDDQNAHSSPEGLTSNANEVEMQPLSGSQSSISDVISLTKEFKFDPSSQAMVSRSESVTQIEFNNGLCKAGFDCHTGNLTTYQISDGSVEGGGNSKSSCLSPFVEPLQFNFYRAPTDNDRGGGDKQAPLMVGLKQVGILGAIVGGLTVGLSREQGLLSYSSCWKSVGLDRLESQLLDIRAGGFQCANRPQDIESYRSRGDDQDSLWIVVQQSHGPPIKTKRPLKLKKIVPLFRSRTIFVFDPDGSFTIHPQISPWILSVGYALPNLPRIGLTFTLHKNCRQVAYFGCGPHENYNDRKSSTIVGVYQTSVDSMFEPYIVPSEYGGRQETRWVSVTSSSHSNSEWPRGHGILVQAVENGTALHPLQGSLSRDFSDETDKIPLPDDPTFHFSCHPYSWRELEAAKHPSDLSGYQLTPRLSPDESMSLEHKPTESEPDDQLLGDTIRLNVDFEHMGLGGECSWFSCVDRQYLINPAPKGSQPIVWGSPIRVSLIKQSNSMSR